MGLCYRLGLTHDGKDTSDSLLTSDDEGRASDLLIELPIL